MDNDTSGVSVATHVKFKRCLLNPHKDMEITRSSTPSSILNFHQKYSLWPFADQRSLSGKWEVCLGSVYERERERGRKYSKGGEFLMKERKPGRRGLPGTHRGENRKTKTGWLSGWSGTFWNRDHVAGESWWQQKTSLLPLLFLCYRMFIIHLQKYKQDKHSYVFSQYGSRSKVLETKTVIKKKNKM